MHHAPAVSYPVGRSRFHGLLVWAVIMALVAALTAWTLQADAVLARHVVAAVLGLLTAAGALRQWWLTPVGNLTWDGQDWRWTSGGDPQVVDVAVVLDGQSALLLCLRTPRQQLSLVWPERRMAPPRWLALRRAVFARQSAHSGRDGEPMPS
ncbi:hypothetical protein [Rhodoferax sp.]|uniref:hypothetical protein n=1 Tax=Rhodoferax sp. TaxID=50421 RepID=UPI00260F503B|nr:hypothetical protein [Rhodoferax sp.]MDD2924188.1 hypothetical protein [Rhodoferax sp.]